MGHGGTAVDQDGTQDVSAGRVACAEGSDDASNLSVTVDIEPEDLCC